MALSGKKVQEYAQRWGAYERDPVAFLADVFGWTSPAEWQRNNLYSVAHRPRTATSGAQGTGKGSVAAGALLHHIGTRRDSKGAALSTGGKTLKVNIWAEVAKLYQRSDQFQRMFELTATQLVSRWRPLTWFIVARTAASRYSHSDAGSEKVSEAAAGMYADDTLTCVDEASGVDDAVFDAIEGTASTPRRRLFYEGNPVRRIGRFAAIFLQSKFAKGWCHFYVSKLDSPWTNTPEARALWEADIERFGPESAYVQARVWGRFPRAGTIDTMVTVDDVMLAWTRRCGQILGPDGEPISKPEDNRLLPLDIGVDPARYGDDLCAIVVRRGLNVLDLVTLPKSSEVQIKLVLMQLAKKYRGEVVVDDKGTRAPAPMRETTRFRVDEGGVGGPLIDELQNDGWTTYAVDFGSTHSMDAKSLRTFANLGAYVWGNGADVLKRISLAGVPHRYRQLLLNQLVTRQYHFSKGGRQRITLLSKEEMRSKGMGSPDLADGLMLCICDLDCLGAGHIDETIAVL